MVKDINKKRKKGIPHLPKRGHKIQSTGMSDYKQAFLELKILFYLKEHDVVAPSHLATEVLRIRLVQAKQICKNLIGKKLISDFRTYENIKKNGFSTLKKNNKISTFKKSKKSRAHRALTCDVRSLNGASLLSLADFLKLAEKSTWFHSVPFRMYNTTQPAGPRKKDFVIFCRGRRGPRRTLSFSGGIYRGKGMSQGKCRG